LRFQSTPSGGKATWNDIRDAKTDNVSIHAFRGEGDPAVHSPICSPLKSFQSTPSGGKATSPGEGCMHIQFVSIHAFRGEGDSDAPDTPASAPRFNPRLPGGRRPALRKLVLHDERFNPRLPGGRRRSRLVNRSESPGVSIHAFRGEGDARLRSICRYADGFQSTPSGGKATSIEPVTVTRVSGFQSTPSGGKATRHDRVSHQHRSVSIHAFRGEGDH